MKLMKLKKIVDVIYYIAIGFSVIVISKNYYERWSLPEGACPVDNNYNLIVSAIVILVISFIASTYIDQRVKKEKATEEET